MSRSTVAYWQDERHQSEADHAGVSLAAYIHAIHHFLRQAECRNVLMIGCGGGTLATMLRADGVKVTIVEINPRSFAISRRYFHLPDDVECHVGDGRAFLRASRRRYDAIVLDAYDGNRLPAQMGKPSFFKLARSRLHPMHGVLFVNVVMRNDRDRHLDSVAALMRKAFAEVRLLDAKGTIDRNAVAMAGAVADLTVPTMTIRPKAGVRLLRQEIKAMAFRAPKEKTKRVARKVRKSR
ncbi:MAG TPA: fused MFS/spermidine synthase [Reyranella sp.]